jgi:DNA-directed RNA polymerase specialized sigma24 family protein
MANRSPKRDWALTEESLNKLLEALDPHRQRAAEQYEHVRRSLIRYFHWRGMSFPERDADETIDRVACKLGEVRVDDVYKYILGVARNVAHESLRARSMEQTQLAESVSFSSETPADAAFARRVECCEACLAALPPQQRDLVLAYYEGEKQVKIENRRQLAEKTGIPIERLRIQVHRIREKLELCIKQCVSVAEQNGADVM